MKRTLFFFLALPVVLSAQDVHWAQPSNNLLVQNPAFTGIAHRYSAALDYRSQWNAVGTDYHTYLLAGDGRFGKADPDKVTFSGGGIVYSDMAGDGNYRTTSIGATFSSIVRLNDNMRFGAGLGFNLVQGQLKPENFSWGSQFNGQFYDPALGSGENLATLSRWYGDLGAGVSLAYAKDAATTSSNDKTDFVFGYSLHHINRPDVALAGGGDAQQMRHALFATGNIGLKNKNVSLKPTAFAYLQGPLFEVTAGTLVAFQLGEHSQVTGFKKGSGFACGALYRVNDALIPTAQFEKGGCLFGISYDVNVSGLSSASRFRGGPEFSLVLRDLDSYLWRKKDVPQEDN